MTGFSRPAKSMDKKRVLVTGGAGFIGSNFTRQLVIAHPEFDVVVLDKLTYCGRRENLEDVSDRITFIQGDICSSDDIARAGRCDVVFNFAAETHVDRSIADSSAFVRTDVLGTHRLLEYARSCGVDRYVQISTDEVYGSIDSGSFTEESTINPSSPYSASKAGADMLALSYHRTHGLPVVITRSSNNFGPFQYPEKLIPLFILNALRGLPMPIYGDGQNVRDWIYVDDNCSAIEAVFRKGAVGNVYNVSARNERKNIDVAHLLLEHLKKPSSLLTFVADRKGHDRRYSVDNSKLMELGWRPQHDFESSLARTVQWYDSHPDWWRPLVAPSGESRRSE